jgi:hypothetical protein
MARCAPLALLPDPHSSRLKLCGVLKLKHLRRITIRGMRRAHCDRIKGGLSADGRDSLVALKLGFGHPRFGDLGGYKLNDYYS